MTREDDTSSPTKHAYCSICGTDLPNLTIALNHPNAVCDTCDSRAVTSDQRQPDPQVDMLIGDTDAEFQSGDDLVFIDGIKCWRRHRFGGHVTLRDAFDCTSIEEFFDRHGLGEDAMQLFNSPDPPGVCRDTDRILLQQVDTDEMKVHTLGLLSMETGEVIARNRNAEELFGPVEDAFHVFEHPDADSDSIRRIRTDPTRLLSFFYSFGAQLQKPKALYLTPELDRPISGQSGIPEVGALRGLREHELSTNVIELDTRPADGCAALFPTEDETSTQRTLETATAEEPAGSTLTVRYELPYQKQATRLRKKGMSVATSILEEIVAATDDTDYTYLKSFPAVDIHAYRAQREVLTVAVDAETVETTPREQVTDKPRRLEQVAETVVDRLE